MAKIKTLKTCSYCSKEVYKLAAPSRGLCANCYYQEKRTGSLERTKVRKPCSITGCEEMSVAHTYCWLHYGRWKKHGVTESVRFDKWGQKSKHPHKDRHHGIIRLGAENHSPEWAEFWTFVDDVGEMPPGHTLRKKDLAKPWSKDNFFWRPYLTNIDRATKAGRAEYGRAHRQASPDVYRNHYMKRKYGVDLAWYNRTIEEQGGVCAICKSFETALHAQIGMPRNMAIDHCHESGKVRGLLCSKCNTALGCFKDSAGILENAIAYLKKHGAA